MKTISTLLLTFFSVLFCRAQIDIIPPHDSTLAERFLVNILNDYKKEGRWLFIRIDSNYMLKDNYEVVNPITIFNAYTDSFRDFDKDRFIYSVYGTLTEGQTYVRDAIKPHQIKGVKVNMKRYRLMKKRPVSKILNKYFDNDSRLKPKYHQWLYEIIAVCYDNNVKVITPSNGPAYFEIFK